MFTLPCVTYAVAGKNKYVLNFDLDETLIKVQMEDGGAAPLNEKALRWQTVRKVNGCKERVFSIMPIAEAEFKDLFGRIDELNRSAKETVIFVDIITNAHYTEPQIVKILRKFYGDNFRINRYANVERIFDTKGFQMCHNYAVEYYKYGVPHSNIYLIDDQEKNCADFESYNFKALRMTDAERQNSIRDLFELVDGVARRILGNNFSLSQY